MLLPRPPVSSLSPPPLPPPLLPLLPLPLVPWVCRACFLRVDRAWPLYGPPLGGELTILATMAQACLSGVPLPPNGGDALSPLPRHFLLSLVAPFLPVLLVVRGLWLSGVLHPFPSCSPYTSSACCYLGGALPYPSWSGCSPPHNLL